MRNQAALSGNTTEEINVHRHRALGSVIASNDPTVCLRRWVLVPSAWSALHKLRLG
jgi:hypothetical protein